MISKEKFELLKEWGIVCHLSVPIPLDVVIGCVVAGALVAELPDNAALFHMEHTKKLEALTVMVMEARLKLQETCS